MMVRSRVLPVVAVVITLLGPSGWSAADEAIALKAHQSRTAQFRRQVLDVHIDNTAPDVASATSSGQGVTIRGLRSGIATVTVRGKLRRLAAGAAASGDAGDAYAVVYKGTVFWSRAG